jgi:hypothetical protein
MSQKDDDRLPDDLIGRLETQLASETAAERAAALQSQDSFIAYVGRLLNLNPGQATFYEQLSLQAPALMTLLQRMFGI